MDESAAVDTQPQLSEDEYPEEIQELFENIAGMPLEGLQQMAKMMAEDVTAKDIRLSTLAKLKVASKLDTDELRSACGSAVRCLAVTHVVEHKSKQARIWRVRLITCAVFALVLALRMYQQGNLDVVIAWVRAWVPPPDQKSSPFASGLGSDADLGLLAGGQLGQGTPAGVGHTAGLQPLDAVRGEDL